MSNTFQILLYYKYTSIENPAEEMAVQRSVCEVLGLKGRIIVSQEGINGTLEGTREDTEKYISWMNTRREFKNIHWKKSEGTGSAFPRLSIKVRNEIVSLHLGDEDVDPTKFTGIHLKPEELRKWYEEGKKFSIVDMRNDYELEVGKFENTIFPGLENFRDLKEKVKEIEHLKETPVLTVCTGGVRCEKASGYLKKEGFKDVYQLDGGIVSYMEKYPGKDFKGSLYVFDGRVVMNFNDPESHEILGKCYRCQLPSERYVNCQNLACHKHVLLCEECESKNGHFCSEKCMHSVTCAK